MLFVLVNLLVGLFGSDDIPFNASCEQTLIADVLIDRMFPKNAIGNENIKKPKKIDNTNCYYVIYKRTIIISGYQNETMAFATNLNSSLHYKKSFLRDISCGTVPEKPNFISSEVTKLVLKNTNITYLDEFSLKSWSFIEELRILMNNKFTDIKPKSFAKFKKLWNLEIIDNPHFSRLDEESLSGLTGLKGLFLQRNNIRSIADISKALDPKYVPHLVHLDLTGNMILEIGEHDFEPLRGGVLYTLLIGLTKTYKIHPRALDPLGDGLVSLVFSELNVNIGNLVEVMNRTVTANANLKYMSLEQNLFCGFPKKLIEVMSKKIVGLFIGRNHFGLLKPGSFVSMSQLKYLDLTDVMMDEIPEGVINSTIFPQLRHLYLANNKFTRLTLRMVTPTLSRLTLTKSSVGVNDLDSSQMESYFVIEQGVLKAMPFLELLDLSGNNLNQLTEFTFKDAPGLKVLLLKGTSLNAVAPRAFSNNKKLYYLDLSNNPFPLVTKQKSRFLGDIFYGLANLLALDLSYCNINSLPRDTFIYIRNIQYLSLRGNPIFKLETQVFQYVPLLKTLDLRYNILISWQQRIFTNSHCIKKLMLNFNNLLTLTDAMLKDFNQVDNVDLFANSIACNCDLVNNVNKLNFEWRNSSLAQVTKCSYPDVCTLEEYIANHISYCVCYKPAIIACSIMLAIITSLIMAVLYVKYKYDIQYKFLLCKKKLGFVKSYRRMRPAIPGYFQYDAFVSYSASDSSFVERMRLILEKDGSKFKLCVFERDFRPGDNLVEKILECMEVSKVTILVLTEAFAKSEWCRWEMTIAQNRTISQRFLRDSLILIIKNKVDESLMTPTLRYLMDTRVYLEWHEHSSVRQNIFWVKLKDVLKERTQNKISLSEDRIEPEIIPNVVRKRIHQLS